MHWMNKGVRLAVNRHRMPLCQASPTDREIDLNQTGVPTRFPPFSFDPNQQVLSRILQQSPVNHSSPPPSSCPPPIVPDSTCQVESVPKLCQGDGTTSCLTGIPEQRLSLASGSAAGRLSAPPLRQGKVPSGPLVNCQKGSTRLFLGAD